MKIDLLDPFVEASPGQTATCRVRVTNDSIGPSAYRLRVVGLYDVDIEYPLGLEPLPAGSEASFEVRLDVPPEFAAGRHSLAVEVRSDRRGEQPVLAGMTVDVSSIQKVALRVNPSTIKGRVKGRFRLDIDNLEDRNVDLDLRGESPELDVRLGRTRVRLKPGDSVSVSGSVRGDRRFVRDAEHYVLNVSATGRSAPVYADAAFIQRPLFPRRLRTFMLYTAMLALWAGIVCGGAYWWVHRNDPKVNGSTALVDENGELLQPLTPTAGTDPNDPNAEGSTDGGAAGGSDPAAGGEEGAAGAEADGTEAATRLTSVDLTGTVKAGETGENANVTVTLEPAVLGGDADQSEADQASLARGDAGPSRPAKIWPARYNRADPKGVSVRRSTETIVTALSDGDGVWVIPDVAIPDNYEIRFSKPGFDTQAFIITPPEDGTPLDLKVQLQPGKGRVGGVVTGPDGPIGGVDIVITDGELTFSTRSSSEAGSVGRWKVPGLSTPNTYTLTATLRGFGTEVQQIQLGAGEPREAIAISMKKGVGTISGRINAAAEPLGGVTITASSGDLSRTTTSLTLGDSGSYSLPQLKIPGTYTVTAAAAGYMTQTRELVLDGNAPDIDFSLIRTTGSISGLVTSDVLGSLPGVGITVSRDDLFFNSTTAVAPSAGTFQINDLPPGDYLIKFSRFDHVEISQLFSVVAGQNTDFGTIAMTFRERTPLAETGRVVVSVFDTKTVALGGATVQLRKISDGSLITQLLDKSGTESAFAFDPVPIGTYTVRVSKPGFRTAAKRVTVGLNEVTVPPFTLLELGQVTGRLIDAVTAGSGAIKQLDDYQVRIYELNSNGTRKGDFIDAFGVRKGQQPDLELNVLFESEPSLLGDGLYELEISSPTPGYSVSNNQAIDPGDPTLTRMQFRIDPTDEGTIRLNDIRADPFPSLGGRIYLPRLVGTDPNDIGFDPADTTAAITLTCEGSTGSATALLSNQVGGSGLDTYTFTPEQLDEENLLGVCSLNVVAAGINTVDIPLGAPLAVSSGGASSGRIVNIAISKEADDISGDVFWVDGRHPTDKIPVSTVNIITEGDVITGFKAAAPGGTNLPEPILAETPIEGLNVAGVWSISGQIFGKTTYLFTGDPDYKVGTLSITIDETKRTVVAVQDLSIADPAAPSLQVQLQPQPGTIDGTLITYPAGLTPVLTVNANSPTAPITAVTSDPATGMFSIPSPEAGTWDLTYTAPAGYRFKAAGLPTTSGVAPFVLAPAGSFTDNPELVKLATLGIVVQGPLNPATPDPTDRVALTGPPPTVTLTRVARTTGTGDPLPGDPGDASIPVTLDGANSAFKADLPVNWLDPTGEAADYFVSVTKDGYDTETVQVDITGNGANTGPDFVAGTDISVPLKAGENRTLSITLAKFGTITGTVEGIIPWADAPTANELLNISSLQITAVRSYTLTDTTTPAPALPAATVSVDPDNAKKFVVVGPPGYYTITVKHPNFADPPTTPPVDPLAPAGLFTLGNAGTNNLSPYELTLKPSAINITAINGAGGPISNATIRVTGGPTTVAETNTAIDGKKVIGNLAEGTYTVEVRDFGAGTTDVRFPVRVNVTVTRGDTANDRSVDLTVRLVSLDGSITGFLGALNNYDRPVALPLVSTITRTYTAGQTGNVDGTDKQNQATEDGDLPAGVNPTNTHTVNQGSPASAAQMFTLSGLPRGDHKLTFSTASGYTSPTGSPTGTESPLSAAITTNSFSFPTQINYRALNVPVEITVVSNRTSPNPVLPSATVKLVKTWAPLDPAITPTSSDSGVYTFSVPPDLEKYQIVVTDPLHATNDTTLIMVDPGTATVPQTVVMTPSVGNINGFAYKQTNTSTTGPLVSQGTISLLDATDDSVIATVPSVNTNSLGKYTFANVGGVGPYKVQVELAGHVTNTSTSFSIILGGDNDAPAVTVKKFASATITAATTAPAPTFPLTGSTDPFTTAATCTNTKCDFAGLDPDQTYTFYVSPGAAEIDFFFPSSTTTALSVGTNATGNVTLAQRDLSIQVVTTGSATDSNTATVVLKIPASSAGSSKTGTTSSIFNFPHVRKSAGTVTVSRTNYLTTTMAVPEDTSPDAEDPIVVTLPKALTTVTGTISGIPAGFSGTLSVRATSGGGVQMPGIISGTGTSRTFTIADVPWGTWTVSADGLGAGAGTTTGGTVVVNATAAPGAVRDIALVARPLGYLFKVKGTSPSAALGNVNIVMAGVPGITDNSGSTKGEALISVSEQADRTWTASRNGYITQTQTGQVIGVLGSNTTVPVTMVEMPAIGGNVQDGAAPPANIAFNTVLLCAPLGAVDTCVVGGADVLYSAAPTATVGKFDFTPANMKLAPDTYRIRAIKTGTPDRTADTTITITASGTAIPSITLQLSP